MKFFTSPFDSSIDDKTRSVHIVGWIICSLMSFIIGWSWYLLYQDSLIMAVGYTITAQYLSAMAILLVRNNVGAISAQWLRLAYILAVAALLSQVYFIFC